MPRKLFLLFTLVVSYIIIVAQPETPEQEYLRKFSLSFVKRKIYHNGTNFFWSLCLGEGKELSNQELSERFSALQTDSNKKVAFYKRLNYYLSGSLNYYTDFLQLWNPGTAAGNAVSHERLKEYTLLISSYGEDPLLLKEWTIGHSSGNRSSGDTNEIYNIVEEYPEFPGGDVELINFLRREIIYPQFERDNDIQGKVVLRFTICEDGYLCSAETIRGVTENLNAEAKRIIKMMPLWKPGKLKGQTVPVYFQLPVAFRLN